MGLKCRILRDSSGNIESVEAPNGKRSKLFDDARQSLGTEEALNVVLTAYTDMYIDEVKKPQIINFRKEIVSKIKSIPSRNTSLDIVFEGKQYNINPSNIEMDLDVSANGDITANFSTTGVQTSKERNQQVDNYLQRLSKLKKEDPSTYWSLDEPASFIIEKAARDGRIVDVSGGMGMVTEDGDIVGVFKYDTKAKGTADKVLNELTKLGGKKLDNFDGYLTKIYERNGFRVTSRVPFSEENAPEDWNPEVHGRPDVVAMVFDPNGELDIEEKTFEDYQEALEYRDSFIESKLSENKTGDTQKFFSDVVQGKDEKFKAKKEWKSLLPFNRLEKGFKRIYDQFMGNFDTHIATSIPTFRETQIKVGSAITNMFKGQNALIYDIGGSEGGFVKAITKASKGKIRSINLDVNRDMQAVHEKNPVEGSVFINEAFYEGYTDEDEGVTYEKHVPSEKADVVHESMVFQFITPERKQFIKEIKDNYIKEDGIVLLEEKLIPETEAEFLANEQKKDQDYKSIYYSQEELKNKSEKVLVGMKKNQTAKADLLRNLRDNFDYVGEYWDSGNFKGYYATNSRSKAEQFIKELGGKIKSEFSSSNIKKQSTPNTKNINLGFIQLQERPEGYQIKLSNVNDAIKSYSKGKLESIRGKGIGTELYKKLSAYVTENSEKLYSDFNSKGAAGIWNRFSRDGIATTETLDGKDVNVIKDKPDSLDENGEPRLNDVISYISSKNNENTELSEEEKVDVENALLGSSYRSSTELNIALKRAIMPNGIFNPSESSLVESGLYSRAEARNIMRNQDLQVGIYELHYKLNNSDEVIINDMYMPDDYVTMDSLDVTSLGKFRVNNPYINEKEAIQNLGGIKDENQFLNKANNGYEYAANKFDELSVLTRIPRYRISETGIVRDTYKAQRKELLENTLTTASTTDIIESTGSLMNVPSEVWVQNFNDVAVLLKQIENDAIDIGLDLSGLSELAYDKRPSEVKNLLIAINNFANLSEETTFEILAETYLDFFEVSAQPMEDVRNIPYDQRNKTLYTLDDTGLNSYELFDQYGLMPIGEGLYQKVNTLESLDSMYDKVYRKVQNNPQIFPPEIFRSAYDGSILDRSFINNPANMTAVKKDIRNYVQSQIDRIDLPQVNNMRVAEKMVLYATMLNTKFNVVESVPQVESQIDVIMNYPRNNAYLQSEFVSDFYKDMLKEKVKDSSKYKAFYSNFTISNQGIELINTDPITMRTVESYATEDLKNHFRLRKDYSIFNEESDLEVTDVILRNYYTNFPKALTKFTGEYQLDNGTLITNVTKDFLRVNEGVFEFVKGVGGKSFYGSVLSNGRNFVTYTSTLDAPNIIDTSKYESSEGNITNKEIKNVYSKKQGEDISNEIDDC